MAKMSLLRRRTIEGMTVRNLSPGDATILHPRGRKFSRYFGRSMTFPDFADTGSSGLALCLIGRDIPDGRMAPMAIVISFD
jgi:hypothetical protein